MKFMEKTIFGKESVYKTWNKVDRCSKNVAYDTANPKVMRKTIIVILIRQPVKFSVMFWHIFLLMKGGSSYRFVRWGGRLCQWWNVEKNYGTSPERRWEKCWGGVLPDVYWCNLWKNFGTSCVGREPTL